jgi:peptidoglycan/xylan/chitin deacetylase (PgdA/CDA1 family)
MSLAMSLHGRGPAGTVARTATVVSRFGATTSAMARRLDRYDTITSGFGIRPTLPATACVLARHPELLRRYAERGIEIALHGLVHGDHAVLDERRQRETIERAVGIFERHGFQPSGFRGPYLRYNAATLDVLRALGLRYHSSQAVSIPLLAADPGASATASYQLALRLYSAVDARRVAVTPRLEGGLVDMPVAVPDDEILLDRLRLDGTARTAEWRHILGITYARGELFTIQLHPERIDELGDALSAVLSDARRLRPAVYVARLDDIASWWQRRSGFSLRVTRRGEHRVRVRLEADDDATFLIRGLRVASTPWHGRDAITELRDFEVEAGRLPVVSVSHRSPEAVRRFVAEEGFAFEISDDPQAYGAHLDVADPSWSEADVLDTIERAPGPLVRVWRWPDGARSALAATGDIDALTLRDFVVRSWETRDWVPSAGQGRP